MTLPDSRKPEQNNAKNQINYLKTVELQQIHCQITQKLWTDLHGIFRTKKHIIQFGFWILDWIQDSSCFLFVHVIVLSCPLSCISSTTTEFHSFGSDPALDDIGGESGGICRAGERSTLGDGRAASSRLADERLHHLRQSQLLLQRQRASGPEEPGRCL